MTLLPVVRRQDFGLYDDDDDDDGDDDDENYDDGDGLVKGF